MELRLTVVDRGGREEDVLVTAAAGTPVAELPFAGAAPLLDGARVRATGGVLVEPPPGPRQLRVVSGPDAGRVHTLRPGVLLLGRAPTADLSLDDAELSRVHAAVEVGADGVRVRDAGSANGTWLDGAEVGPEPVPLPPGAVLRCGASLLVHTAPTDPPATVRPDGAGGLALHRPPRLRPGTAAAEVTFPAAPPDRPRLRFPWLLVTAPLLIGGVLWFATGGNQAYLLLTLLSPAMFAANALSDRLSGARDHGRALRSYEERLRRASAERDEALARESAERRAEAPDPAAVLLTAVGPGARLWERRRGDDDALLLRVGTAALPARLRLHGVDERPTVAAVPVAVPLRAIGVLGVAGAAGQRYGSARWLVGQLATLHSPRDLRFVLLSDEPVDRWRWLRWLPHRVTVGVGAAQVAATAAELADRVDAVPVVVVLDGADRLRAVPAVARILAHGPAGGVFAVCLVDSALPEECGAAVICAGSRLRVAVAGAPPLHDVLADLVSPDWAERLARALAPVRDTTPDAAALARRVRLAELLAPDAFDPATVAARWAAAPRSTRFVLGAGAGGPVTVDLAVDGPHALVAGTTGSGKSELLRTLVAGLALANRPDQLTFLLVDYKGGAAFGACARLPHTAGLVTDLDGRLTARALESLGAELRRRERLLAEAGVGELSAYQAAGGALARLVIVVDEFASLAAELPGFVAGLVDIARRGRSLGVHLVLATQRPAGVVSAEIRANTALRICLRVTDAGESADVLDAPDAATIDRHTPGRGYARLAGGGLTPVQTARVGGQPPLPVASRPQVTALCWPRPDVATPAAPPGTHTDLDALVDAVRAAATLAGATPAASPWLPPLPPQVTVEQLDRPPKADRLPLGLHDLPAEQRRDLYAYDLAAGGHLIVAGGARSGRTSALRTLAAGLSRLPVDRAHLYALDCAGGGLACLSALPHCGAVVPRADTALGTRLLIRLDAELTRRQAATSVERPPPWLVLLVDSWEGFAQAYDGVDQGRPAELLLRLVREGGAAGIRVVLTGDRALLTARIAALVGERLVLRMADPDSYPLAGIPPGSVPAWMPPGRALVRGDTVTEVQVALLDGDPSAPAQVAALRRIAAAAPTGGREPFRLRSLPGRIALDALAPSAERGTPLWTVLGVGGDDAAPVGLDLDADGPGVLVAGPPGSGRSTVLRTAAVQHLRRGTAVAVVATHRSPLADLPGRFGPDEGDALRAAVVATPALVVVDDADQLLDTDVDAVLGELLTRPGCGVLAAGGTAELHATYRGFTVPLRRSRSGVLLCPGGAHDGELLGTPVTRGLASRPGRGVLVRRGRSTPIQVALVGEPAWS